jgi:hypothetical protein
MSEGEGQGNGRQERVKRIGEGGKGRREKGRASGGKREGDEERAKGRWETETGKEFF